MTYDPNSQTRSSQCGSPAAQCGSPAAKCGSPPAQCGSPADNAGLQQHSMGLQQHSMGRYQHSVGHQQHSVYVQQLSECLHLQCGSPRAQCGDLGSFWRQAVEVVCWSATHLPSISESYLLCVQVELGQASVVRLGPLWGLCPIGYVSSFSENSLFSGPRLGVVFRRLVRLGSFPACWRQANVTPIPKGPPSSSVANYRMISITSVMSTVFECLVSVRLGRFMEHSGVLPTTQFAYRKGLGTCDALLCFSHKLQSALESGQEARIV